MARTVPPHRSGAAVETARALLLNGTVGAGKTTTAAAVAEVLIARAVPHAVVDLDQLRRAWPAPPGDRFHSALGLRNLAAVAREYRSAGVERLVLAGVLETAGDRAGLEEALGERAAVCRLRVPADEVQRRLEQRSETAGELGWYALRAPELAAIQDAAGVDDAVVEVRGEAPDEVAAAVLRAIGW